MTMKRSAFRLLTVLVSISVMFGCSVKEERDVCPCRLFLDFTQIDMSFHSPLALYVTSDDEVVHKAVLDTTIAGDTCVVDVPRGDLQVVAWSGDAGLVYEGELVIPAGSECPPVYVHSSQLAADGEAVFETMLLRKNHCVLSVDFANPERVAALELRGHVGGFDRLGNPVEGDFYVCSNVDSIYVVPISFCLPRQIGHPLYLDVIDINGKMKTFPLHEYIRLVNYDWMERDLKDLSLLLNYTEAKVAIVVQGWDEEIVLDVVI